MRPVYSRLLAVLLCTAAFAPPGVSQSTALFTISAPSPAAASAGSGALTVGLTVRQNYQTTSLPQYGLCLYTGVASTAVARSASSTATNPTFTVPAADFDIPPASFSSGRYAASLNLQVVGTACSANSTLSNTLAFPLVFPSISSVSLAALAQPNGGVDYATYPASLEIKGTNLNSGSGATFAFTGQGTPATAFQAGTYLASAGSLVVPIPRLAEAGATGLSLSACNTSAHYRYCSAGASLASFALAASSTQLTSSVSSPATGQATTLVATVTPGPGSTTAGGIYAPGPPSGLVTFTDGSTTLGTAPLVASSLTFAAGSPQTISAPSNSGARVGGNAQRVRARVRSNDTPSPDNSTSFSSLVADFNLDGVKDVLVIDANSGNFHLLLGGSPTGNFQAEHLIASGCSYLAGATTGDFNGDGYPDLAYLCFNDDNTSSLFALYNLGDGTFGPATAVLDATGAPLVQYGGQIGSGDLNKDGRTDLVVTGVSGYPDGVPAFGIQTFLGDGAGHFTAGAVSSTTADPGSQLVVQDLNNDGAADLVLLSSSTTTYQTVVQTYRNSGSGGFTPVASLPVCDCYTYTAKLFVTPLTANPFYPDLVVAAPDQGQVLVALNQRTATLAFAPAVAVSVPDLVDAVLGDLNGDGFADLVFFDGSRITALNGDGAGHFAAQPSSPNFTSTGYSAANVSLVAATDVNQDGYADLVAIYPGNTFTSTINTFVTTGSAIASLPATFSQAGTHRVATAYPGNVNLLGSTGALSLVVTQTPPAASLLTYSPVPSTIPYGTALVAGQFDAVARTASGVIIPGTFTYNHAVGDLLMAGSQTLTATFAPQDPNSFQGGTVSSTLTVLPSAATVALSILSNGTQVTSVPSGSVVSLTATVSGIPATSVTGQVNFCDASATFCTDIHLLGSAQLTSAGTATLRFLPGLGAHRYRAIFTGTRDYGPMSSAGTPLAVTGAFATSTTLATSGGPANYVLTATVAGLGSPVLGPTGSVSFLDAANANNVLANVDLGPSTTTQTFPSQPAAGVAGTPLATADFNGDGIPDVISGTSPTGGSSSVNQTLSVYLGKGDGTFILKSTVNLPAGQAVTGDFNHDGNLDIALSSGAGNTVSLLLGNGDGTFAIKSTTPVPGGIGTLLVGDFDRDGLLDLATGSTTTHSNPTAYTGTLTVLLGAGDGTFTAVQTATSVGAASLATADFNGDAIPDLVAGDFFAQTASVFLGKGDGTFTLKSTNTIQNAQNAASFAAADYNNDGIADIASLDFYNNSATILLGKGDGTFTQGASLSDPTAVGEPNAFNIACGDFNQDGIADLAITADDGVSLYLGAGDGTFTMSARAVPQTVATESQGHEDFGLLLADFNGDGLLDVATGAPGFTLALNTLTATASATAGNVALPGYGPHAVTARYAGDANFASSASAPASLTGQPVTPILTFNPLPTSFPYGTLLPATLFNATVASPTGGPIAGAITYNHAPGDLLAAGSPTLTAVFTPMDLLSYTTASVTRTLTVTRATPVISFPTPPTAIVGTPLSAVQLNPTVTGVAGPNLPGTLSFTPSTGVVASGPQTLTVTFTPQDIADYNIATTTVVLNGAAVTLTGLSSSTAQLGDPTRTITLTGTGFAGNSTARANGSALTTTFVNATTLTAVLPASSFLAVQTLQISVFNQTQNQTTAALPFTVVPAPVGAVTFTGPATVSSGDQPILRFSLANPYPVDLTATVTLTFAPIAGGVDDPAIQFRSGGRTFTFTLAAGQTTSPTIQLQSGTVAGTIQATLALFLANPRIDVTPTSAAPIVITNPPAAPAISTLTVTRSGRQLIVNTFGLANTRAVTQATFHFTPAAGQQIQTQDITLDVTALFSGWYSQAVSATYGSTFLYTQTFNLDDDATVVGQVTLTLSNGVGTSAPGSSN